MRGKGTGSPVPLCGCAECLWIGGNSRSDNARGAQRAVCLGARGKPFDRVELLQNQTELSLFMDEDCMAAAMDDGQ